ncbi:hypothetical protein ABZT06_27860 [Streptomyces sp. NPDC005483]|uniref:hypothetical protein n=1 Tax=Streptomyces sp. NPDC005483 TaxID=3154882 RepID=UPI0033B82BEB
MTPRHPTSGPAPVCLFTPVVHKAVRPSRHGELKITDALPLPIPLRLDRAREGCAVVTGLTATARWYRTHHS